MGMHVRPAYVASRSREKGYSARRATMGSIDAARNAGIKDAMVAIAIKSPTEASSTQGSCGEIS